MLLFAPVARIRVVLLLIVSFFVLDPAAAQQAGKISGVVVDAESGETLIGANAVIQDTTLADGTALGATTDLDGRFEIKGLAPGTYRVRLSYVGFQAKVVEGVEVSAGATTKLEVSLAPETAELEEIVVQVEAARDSEAGLLRQRQKAAAFSNAISAEAISGSGASTAADALGKVTGASVLDGKYINVRGLSGRYVNTQLNGSTLPSADPDENSVPLDLFPSGLLDNIVASKTFTPDQPGSFTGGNINLSTKAYPERLNVVFSTSASFNSEIGLGDMLQATGGLDDVPRVVDNGEEVPSIVEAKRDPQKAERLDAVSRAFSQTMIPVAQGAPVNQSYGLSFGNQFALFGDRPLGVVASFSYDQSTSGYSDGRNAQYNLTGDVSNVEALNTELELEDAAGTRETLLGGLANLSFKPRDRHELGLNLLYNRSEEQSARYQSGAFPRDLSTEEVYETRTLRQTERELMSLQGRGEHVFGKQVFGSQSGVRLNWSASLARTTQDEPDFRFFANHFAPNGQDTLYAISPALYPQPTRYFRNLTETNRSGELAVTVPIRAMEVKVGGSYLQKERAFRERRFEYLQDQARYDGNAPAFFGEEVGIVGQDEDGRVQLGSYIVEASQPANNYDGEQRVTAGFAMLDTPVFDGLRFVGGLRAEHTDMSVVNQAKNPRSGQIEELDLLPSASLIYGLTGDMNLRLAYGRTLARPSFLEFAPFSSYRFIGGRIETGNPDLQRTLTHNLDLRWEWFVRPGELLAVSAFFKDFTSPIERVIDPRAAGDNSQVVFENVGNATVYGLEVEARQHLDGLASWLQHVEVGANLTLTQSKVAIAPRELELIRAYEPDAADTRELQGQSPYVFNADLGYNNPEMGTSLGLFYNVFGERLHAVANGPDLYEQPRRTFDLVAAQRLPFGVQLKFSAKNLLDARYEVVQSFKGREFVNQRYALGRSYSLGLKYTL